MSISMNSNLNDDQPINQVGNMRRFFFSITYICQSKCSFLLLLMYRIHLNWMSGIYEEKKKKKAAIWFYFFACIWISSFYVTKIWPALKKKTPLYEDWDQHQQMYGNLFFFHSFASSSSSYFVLLFFLLSFALYLPYSFTYHNQRHPLLNTTENLRCFRLKNSLCLVLI